MPAKTVSSRFKAVSTFGITIPTKSYLRKYIHTRYGYPVQINNKTLIGVVILAILEKKKAYYRGSRSAMQGVYSSYCDKVELSIPKSYITGNIYGLNVSTEKAIMVNRYFEQQFIEDLYNFCRYNLTDSGKHPGYDVSIYKFAERHKIEIDVDITFEALKKMEYRYRKNIEKKDDENVPCENAAAPTLF